MKKWNRYVISMTVLAGLIFLWFPVVQAGGMEITMTDLLAYWKREDALLAVWAAAVVTAPSVTVLLSMFGKKKDSMIAAIVLELLQAVSVVLLCSLRTGGAVLPAWGGLCAAVCHLAAAVLCCLEIIWMNRAELQRRQEAARRQAEEQRQEAARRQAEEQRQEKARRQAETQRQEKARRQAEAAKRQEEKQGSLWIGCGTYQGSLIPLGHMQTVCIGRDAAQCNLVVDGTAVSRKHCTVTYNAVSDKYLLLDTSTNGTYLEEGQRIPKSFAMELNPGLKFYLGVPENAFRLGQ